MFSGFVKKIKDKRGGTMLISLVYFMFAAMVGGFMITSTHGSTYRLTRLRQESQNFYDAKSAANLVTDMFSKMKYSFELWEGKGSDGKPVYFVETIYPYAIKDTIVNGATGNNGKTYPVGEFKFNDGNGENSSKMKEFFELLFSNHTANRNSTYRSSSTGNDLVNMFVTTQGVVTAFPQVFPKDAVGSNGNGQYSDINKKTILFRLAPLYTNGSSNATNLQSEKFYDKDDKGNWKAFETYVKNSVNGNTSKTLLEMDTGTVSSGERAIDILNNIAKSTAGEYSFHNDLARTVDWRDEVQGLFSNYHVTIKFVSNNDNSAVNPKPATANDLFVCVVEIRPRSAAVSSQTPLYTMTSKCTIEAVRSADSSQPADNSTGPVCTKVTMSWKDWQNVHVTSK